VAGSSPHDVLDSGDGNSLVAVTRHREETRQLFDSYGQMVEKKEKNLRKKQEEAEPRSFGAMLWQEWIKPILIILAVLAPLRSAVADWNDVPTGSMKPTILEGDRVVVNKLAYDLKIPFTTYSLATWDDPKRGNIVVLFSPADGRRLVKRVVGLPGDTIMMRNNVLFINDEAAQYDDLDWQTLRGLSTRDADSALFATERVDDESYVVMSTPGKPSRRNFGPIVIPKDQYFVMGDNRDNSYDSRWLGFIERRSIVGEVVAVAFSLDRNDKYKPRFSRFFQSIH
jgi:signal peptidase I